jgi:adenylate cyclase
VNRRLAAILAADVVGYSKLMAEDEDATLQQLKRHRAEVFDPHVARHNGRIIKLMGDGTLVEFASVIDAVNCAIAIQSALAETTGAIRLRIGINLGDVIVDGDDIYGDGVNVAARLEPLAATGGVCISDIVYQSVRSRVGGSFADAGEQELKNINQPVRIWQWAGVQDSKAASSASKPAAVPDKPSIAVLPFDNLSGDSDQEFLADGISEDLITALSKIRWFIVIARTSSFVYKGENASVAQVARDLQVRYVLEGSVRRAGQRVRVTAQLVDATTGSHVWAERYDRNIDDIFALQDDMTQTIVSAVDSEIGAVERERALRRPPESLDAWETYQRGLWHLWRFDPPDVAESIRLFQQASTLDPSFAPAFAYEAYAHYVNVIQGYLDNSPENLDKALTAATKAVGLDAKDAIAHFALGRVHTIRGDLGSAISALEDAVALNPNLSQAYHGLGWALVLAGELDRAIDMLTMAIRLSPRDTRVWASMVFMALAYILKQDYPAAADWSDKARHVPNNTGYWSAATLAAAQAQMGRIDEAKETIRLALDWKPDLSLSYLNRTLLVKDKASLEPYLTGLRLAGLPE